MQDDTNNQSDSNVPEDNSDVAFDVFCSAYIQQQKGTPDHDDNEMMICELFALLCGAAAHYSNEKTDYYDENKGDLTALRHIHLHNDLRVYLRAKRYALKLQDPLNELCFLWAKYPAFPTEFKLSEDEEHGIGLMFEVLGGQQDVDNIDPCSKALNEWGEGV